MKVDKDFPITYVYIPAAHIYTSSLLQRNDFRILELPFTYHVTRVEKFFFFFFDRCEIFFIEQTDWNEFAELKYLAAFEFFSKFRT